MQNGLLRDEQITASSYIYDAEPHRARFDRSEGYGAWCPTGSVDESSYQWLQVRHCYAATSLELLLTRISAAIDILFARLPASME